MKRIIFITVFTSILFINCSSGEESNCTTCKMKNASTEILCDNGDGTFTRTTITGGVKETYTSEYGVDFPDLESIIKQFESDGATCR